VGNSLPATPFEKLGTMRLQYIERGKEFNENDIRASINTQWLEACAIKESTKDPALVLPMAKAPEFIPESPERARALRMESRDAKAEMEKIRKANQDAQTAHSQENAELELMKARVARLEAALEKATAPPAEAPAAVPVTDPAPVDSRGLPDERWMKPDILIWADEHSIDLTRMSKPKVFVTKAELLETILTQAAERELVPA